MKHRYYNIAERPVVGDIVRLTTVFKLNMTQVVGGDAAEAADVVDK